MTAVTLPTDPVLPRDTLAPRCVLLGTGSQAEPSRARRDPIVRLSTSRPATAENSGERGRQVNRIDRSNRFAGKWLTGALDDVPDQSGGRANETPPF